MKKSEAVKKLISWGLSNEHITQKPIDEQWSLLLDYLVDDLGFLPPERKATPKDYANIGIDQKFLDDHEFMVNGWEPEDEEK
jgi:hypothetical protein